MRGTPQPSLHVTEEGVGDLLLQPGQRLRHTPRYRMLRRLSRAPEEEGDLPSSDSRTTSSTFVLRGVLPSQQRLASSSGSRSAPTTPVTGRYRGDNSKTRITMATETRITLLEEKALMDRRMTYAPSISMLTTEGVRYPDQTDRHCAWDHYPFDWPPVGTPVSKLRMEKESYYYCVRFFCSLECVQSFARKEFRDDPILYSQTFKLLDEIHRETLKAKGEAYRPLEDAPDWNLLKVVGSGDMAIDDFRSTCKTRHVKQHCVRLPALLRAMEVYERM